MKRRLKTALLIVLCIVLAAGGACGWYALQKARYETYTFPVPENVDELETSPYVIDYIYDPNDLEKVTAAVDDIFVGFVEACIGTTYEDAQILHGKWTGTPATHYRITDLFNLKGTLRTDAPLEAQTLGGPLIGGKEAMVPPGGFLTVGHCYVFLMSANPDGALIFDHCADLGTQVDTEELAAYFDALEAGEPPQLPAGASLALQTVDRYVQAHQNRDLSFEKTTRYPSAYEQTAG